MLHTPHFLVGVAIATQIPDPAVATLAAVTSHFVLDAIPHADYLDEPKITPANVAIMVADGGLALTALVLLVPPEMIWYAFFIGVMANLPDFIEFPGFLWPKWRTLPIMKQFSNWHTGILQYKRELPFGKQSWQHWFWGLLPQVILVTALILLIST
jgi:hypothetical protein